MKETYEPMWVLGGGLLRPRTHGPTLGGRGCKPDERALTGAIAPRDFPGRRRSDGERHRRIAPWGRVFTPPPWSATQDASCAFIWPPTGINCPAEPIAAWG